MFAGNTANPLVVAKRGVHAAPRCAQKIKISSADVIKLLCTSVTLVPTTFVIETTMVVGRAAANGLASVKITHNRLVVVRARGRAIAMITKSDVASTLPHARRAVCTRWSVLFERRRRHHRLVRLAGVKVMRRLVRLASYSQTRFRTSRQMPSRGSHVSASGGKPEPPNAIAARCWRGARTRTPTTTAGGLQIIVTYDMVASPVLLPSRVNQRRRWVMMEVKALHKREAIRHRGTRRKCRRISSGS